MQCWKKWCPAYERHTMTALEILGDKHMIIEHKYISLQSPGGQATFHRITDRIKEAVKETGIKNGICVVFSRHTTCSVITDEDAIDKSVTGLLTLQQDLMDVMEDMIPTCKHEGIYLHPGPQALEFAAEHGEDARRCHNTEAHLRSSMVGRNVTIPIIDGELELGDFSHVFFVDFDQTGPRNRKVSLEIIGV